MLRVTEDEELVRIRAGGTLEEADYDQFAPRFERIAARELFPAADVCFFEPQQQSKAERWVRTGAGDMS